MFKGLVVGEIGVLLLLACLFLGGGGLGNLMVFAFLARVVFGFCGRHVKNAKMFGIIT